MVAVYQLWSLQWEAVEGRNLWEMIRLDSGANSATFVVDYGTQRKGSSTFTRRGGGELPRCHVGSRLQGSRTNESEWGLRINKNGRREGILTMAYSRSFSNIYENYESIEIIRKWPLPTTRSLPPLLQQILVIFYTYKHLDLVRQYRLGLYLRSSIYPYPLTRQCPTSKWFVHKHQFETTRAPNVLAPPTQPSHPKTHQKVTFSKLDNSTTIKPKLLRF